MKTFDEKLQDILNSAWHEGFAFHEEELPNLLKELKALFEAEMREIIGEDDTVSGHEPLGNTHAISNYRRQHQRAALKEKLGMTKYLLTNDGD